MLIKGRDSRDKDIQELNDLLSLEITPRQRFLVERELRFLRSGERGENNAAYYINFYYRDSRNWAIIHDLRIMHDGLTAQIDHLLINRLFDICVIESKNFTYGVKINEHGEFSVHDGKRFHGMPSPIEQNKRHIHLLDKVIKKHHIMPKRLGLSIPPRFKSFIVVSPESKIIRPHKNAFDTSEVIKSDYLTATIMKQAEEIPNLKAVTSVAKLSSIESVVEVAQKIAALHKPSIADYRRRFGINGYCAKCGDTISKKVAEFCRNNSKRFKGKMYCFNCQQAFIE